MKVYRFLIVTPLAVNEERLAFPVEVLDQEPRQLDPAEALVVEQSDDDHEAKVGFRVEEIPDPAEVVIRDWVSFMNLVDSKSTNASYQVWDSVGMPSVEFPQEHPRDVQILLLGPRPNVSSRLEPSLPVEQDGWGERSPSMLHESEERTDFPLVL